MHIILFAAICELVAGIVLQNIGQKRSYQLVNIKMQNR